MTIPDHIRYGSPEECKDALSRPMRCLVDPRWIWPDAPRELPAGELRAIDAAIAQRAREKQGSHA